MDQVNLNLVTEDATQPIDLRTMHNVFQFYFPENLNAVKPRYRYRIMSHLAVHGEWIRQKQFELRVTMNPFIGVFLDRDGLGWKRQS
jgi:hypothetical protein